MVDSGGVTIHNIATSDYVWRGPGLTVLTQQVTCDYADIEHVNSANEQGNRPGATIQYSHADGLTPALPADADAEPYAAVLFAAGAQNCNFQQITTESSPVSVKAYRAQNIHVAGLSANNASAATTTDLPDSALARITDCDSVDVEKFNQQNPAFVPAHRILDVRGNAWRVDYPGYIGQRGFLQGTPPRREPRGGPLHETAPRARDWTPPGFTATGAG